MVKIILVDDDPVSIFTTETLIRKIDVEATLNSFTESDVASKQLIAEITDGNSPDVMFVDINMPIMDGWEFLAALEPYANELKNTDIYVLSSSVNPADRQRALDCFLVKDYIVKPVGKEQLYTLVSKT